MVVIVAGVVVGARVVVGAVVGGPVLAGAPLVGGAAVAGELSAGWPDPEHAVARMASTATVMVRLLRSGR